MGASSAQPSEPIDPLVENGLGSPMCGAGHDAGALSPSAQRNCQTSGFAAALAPTSNYEFDIYASSGGLFGISLDTRALFQEYVLAPIWLALVWVVHVVLAMLEWCYSLDLLESSLASGLVPGLRGAEAAFTRPWLAFVLALAAVLAVYRGLVRRRVTQTLGEVLLMLAMMAGGLWLIVDPSGTLGALGRATTEASLATLGAVVRGTPAAAGRSLTDGMRDVFTEGIEAPWCYLEFGQVRWCQEPAQLDPRLRAAGLRVAAERQRSSGCRATLAACLKSGSPQARADSVSAALLRAARSNGELFLALAPNTGPRNSTAASNALLGALCGSSDIGHCRGPTVAQAQFRTDGSTGQRIVGLLLIWAGDAGMIALLGFLALRLLGAALLTLVYLMLAPGAVLAPAFGDSGRAVFREWAARLFGTVVSKLLYSLLLGAVLAIVRILLSLRGLGWWMQWLLVAALWWGAYTTRQRLLAFVQGEERAAPAPRAASIGARVHNALRTPREVYQGARWVHDKLSRPAPDVEQREAIEQVVRARAHATAAEQVDRTLALDHRKARAGAADAPRIHARLAERQQQLERVRRERERAQASGDGRRAARLGVRAVRIEGEIAHGREQLARTRHAAALGERLRRHIGRPYTREQQQARARFLDDQAALPAAAERLRASRPQAAAPASGAGAAQQLLSGQDQRAEGGAAGAATGAGASPRGRDYAALAGLAGYGAGEYERLDSRRRRQARLEIDRELALRRELSGAAADAVPAPDGQLGRRRSQRAERDFEQALERRLHDGGSELPSTHRKPEPPLEEWLTDARARARRSPVMRDAHDVAARRKRQLGRPRR
jgi:hypothetical protein